MDQKMILEVKQHEGVSSVLKCWDINLFIKYLIKAGYII